MSDLLMLRHSCSHVMAQAVKALWPDVKLAIGPSIEDGFYYDFEKTEPFAPEDLEKIENRMREIIRSNAPFAREEIPKTEAIALFTKLQETYKLELLKEIKESSVIIRIWSSRCHWQHSSRRCQGIGLNWWVK